MVEDGAQLLLKEAQTLGGIHHLLVEPLAQGAQGPVGGLHPNVCPQQGGFQTINHLGRKRVIAQVVEQLGDQALAGFLEALAQTSQPVDLLKRDLINPLALGREHLSGPGEGGVESAQAGLS